MGISLSLSRSMFSRLENWLCHLMKIRFRISQVEPTMNAEYWMSPNCHPFVTRRECVLFVYFWYPTKDLPPQPPTECFSLPKICHRKKEFVFVFRSKEIFSFEKGENISKFHLQCPLVAPPRTCESKAELVRMLSREVSEISMNPQMEMNPRGQSWDDPDVGQTEVTECVPVSSRWDSRTVVLFVIRAARCDGWIHVSSWNTPSVPMLFVQLECASNKTW